MPFAISGNCIAKYCCIKKYYNYTIARGLEHEEMAYEIPNLY